MKDKTGPRAFAEFERELHERLLAVERDLIAAEMKAVDVDAEAIVIEGRTLRRTLKSAQIYMTGAGPVNVERWLYRDRQEDEARAISPMELRLGIVEDFWTPRAAEQSLWVVAQMTPGKSEELFKRVGNMQPSKSSLDRLPKALSERWEESRIDFEATVREALVVPEGTTSVAISIDGVLAPMEDGASVEKRAAAAEDGRLIKGPVGYREIGCGTLAFCDKDGDMLGAIRLARAPEPHKRTVKASLVSELVGVMRQRPDLRIVKIADAVDDNWTFLSKSIPEGEEVIDFFHASEHLHAAITEAYGQGTHETRYRYEALRETLRDEPNGVERVIRALRHLVKTHPRKNLIRRALEYFRRNRRRMRYSELTAQGLMIGSGVVEAACKTLVTQRLKLSGQRWSRDGAQAILTVRGWDQSDRFDAAWALLAATYHTEVTVFTNVIPLRPTHKSPPRRKRAG